MTDEEGRERTTVDRIVECLNAYAVNNGCRGDHDGVCLEVAPGVPAQWCQYCLMRESAQVVTQLRAEIAAVRGDTRRT